MSLLGVGVSGLLANQVAINTTGHNIANAGVDGYSRQEAVLDTRSPQAREGGFVGNGVNVETIRRITNAFLNQQQLVDTANFHAFNSFSAEIGQLDSLVANASTGLSGALDEFYSALQSAADSPTSQPARQLVLSQGARLAERFSLLDTLIGAQEGGVNRQIGTYAAQINELAQSIAGLNNAIVESRGLSSEGQPNDLLDARDEALRELASLVSFTSSVQDGDIVNVFVGGGQALVLANQASEIVAVDNEFIPGRTELGIVVNNRVEVVSNSFTGGKVGGLLSYRESVLGDARGSIGLLAIAVTSSFNAQHRAGVDLQGATGQDFFTPVNSDVLSRSRIVSSGANSNADDRIVGLNIDDISELTGSGYQLALSGSGPFSYVITLANTSTVVENGTLNNNFPQTLETDLGFSIDLTSGSFQNGDRFSINPTLSAATSIELSLTEPSGLALGSPVVSSASLSNSGNGALTQGGLINVGDVDPSNLPAFSVIGDLTPPLLIQFTSATTYDILDNSDPFNPTQLVPPLRNQQYIPNQQNALLPFDPGAQLVSTTAAHVFQPQLGAIGTVGNGYPDPNPAIINETVTVANIDPNSGAASTGSVTLLAGESATTAAARINALNGVTATANTKLGIRINDSGVGGPMEISLNGVDLTDPALGVVPIPITVEFIAGRINQLFDGSGITASSNGLDLTIRSVTGADLNVTNQSIGPVDTIDIVNVNDAVVAGTITGGSEAVIGGTVDLILADGSTLASSGGLFSSPTPTPLSVYVGYQMFLSGAPDVGDKFSIDFNGNGEGDNRNALALIQLQSADVLSGGFASIGEVYGQLIARVGSQSSSAAIDLEAASSLLDVTNNRVASVSGVNLDEEAAKLIEFQQAYSASAQIISVARELFDTLLGAFR